MNFKDAHTFQHFWVAGISYKKTDAAMRGAFAINTAQYEYMLTIAGDFGINEFFLISTCNRTEIYAVSDNEQNLLDLFFAVSGGNREVFAQIAYMKNGAEAIEHLFEVGAGLDSQILGDYEILGQIKIAVKAAKAKGRIGTFTERLVNSVIQSSKAIKTQTQLSGGTVSVSFAAIQYIKNNLGAAVEKQIAVVGTGKIGKSTCKNLVHYLGATDVTIVNRTDETAVSLAKELQVKHAPFCNLPQVLGSADIIIVSTSAEQPIVHSRDFCIGDHKLIFDLSVPCNVDPSVALVPGITLVNVDELSRIKDETLELRRNEVPKALKIIEQHIQEFSEWLGMRKHVPVLKEVKNRLLQLSTAATQLQHQYHLQQADSREAAIQNIINSMAAKMRRVHTPGCHYLQALNDYFTYHGY